LLLYGGAIHEAGVVKARRSARHATSDWMDLEKQRGMNFSIPSEKVPDNLEVFEGMIVFALNLLG